MSASGLKDPKTEVEEEETKPPTSSLIPNVKPASSAPSPVPTEEPPLAVAASVSTAQKVPKTEVVEEQTSSSSFPLGPSNPLVKPVASAPVPASIPRVPVTQAPPVTPLTSAFSDIEFRAMKHEFFQMKGELNQMKRDVAKLAIAFDAKTSEIGDFRRQVQSQLNTILNALSRQDAPSQSSPQTPIVPPAVMPQKGGSLPLNSQNKSSKPAPVTVNPPVQNKQPVSNVKKPQCVLCNTGTHATEQCSTFITVVERRAIMRKQNRCLKCMLPLNNVRIIVHPGCMNRNNCKLCNGNDHKSTFCDQLAQSYSVYKIRPGAPPRHAPY